MSKIVSNKNQLARLVELMEGSPEFARGIWPKPQMNKKWSEITLELNSLGPPERDSAKWQRVWADLKCKTKKKRTENKIELVATGGGPNKLHNLTDTEEAISALMNLDSCIEPPGIEFGLEPPPVVIAEEPVPSTQEESFSSAKGPTRKAMKEKNDVHRLDLLEKQTNAQTNFYKSILDTMNNMQKTFSNIEYYSKKSYQIKKEKLELKKKNMENKENYRQMKLKLRRQHLLLKEKKIDLTNI